MTSPVDLQVRNDVGTLTLRRPPVNALDGHVVAGLERALDAISADPSIKVVVVRGEGRVFSAGADIKMMAGFLGSGDGADQLTAYAGRLQAALNRLASLPIVTIAAVTGTALGGGLEIALACDLRLATEGVVLGLPEANIGLLPGAGGTQRLSLLAGRAFALRAIALSATFSAEEGHRHGVVTEVVAAGSMDDRISEVTAVLTQRDRETLVQIKRCVVASGSAQGFVAEIDATRILASLPSTLELMRAFLAGRSSRDHS